MPSDPIAAAQAQDYLDYRDWLSQQGGAPDTGGSIAVYGPDTTKRYQTNPPKPPPGFVDPASQPTQAQPGPPQPTGFVQPASSGPAGAPHTWSDPALGSKVAAMQQAAATGKVTPDPSAPGAGDAAPTVPPGKRSGVVSNLAAGANDAIAGTLGAPSDLATGALNLPSRAINAVVGTNLPTIQNPVGGSNWWRGAMGLVGADPRDVVSSGLADNLARGVGGGVAGAMLPLGAARAIAAPAMALPALEAGATATSAAPGIAATLAAPSAASTALSGAASGAGGALAERVVPAKYAPLASLVGQVAGGVVPAGGLAAGAGLAKGVASLADHVAAPLGLSSRLAPTSTSLASVLDDSGAPVMGASGAPLQASPNQLDMARDRLAAAAGTMPSAAADSIPAPAAAQTVPGTNPTLAQATGNRGLASLEGQLRGPSNSPSAAPFDAVDARNASARVAAVNDVGGSQDHAAAAGRYVQRRLQQSEAETRARLDKAAQAIGGNRVGGTDETARQAYGAELRQRAKAIDEAGNGQVSRLFRAIDPDGTARLLVTPLRDEGKALRAEMIPGSGAKFTEREEHWISTAEKMPRMVSYASLQQTRRGLGEAVRAARVDGTPSEVRRLTMLKAAVDRSTAEAVARAAAVEQPHVTAGHLAPDQSVLGRLAGHAANDTAPSAGTTVYTPSGRPIGVRYRVVEASTLHGSHTAGMEPNPTYPAELQPRDRTRAASEAQVQRIAGNLQPERLGASASAGEGAPIVGPDGVVESGNARYLAIRRAHAANGPAAAGYRDYLTRQGYDVKGMREPVLVRERTTDLSPEDRVRFTQEANAGTGLAMSASERAAVDAGRLSDDVLGLYHSGDVTSASNRDFVRAFARNVVEKGEEGAFLTKDGTLSLEGVQRVRNALLHRAYGDGGLVAALAESGDEGIRSFGAALTDAAGAMARLRSGVEAGQIDRGVDITRNLVEAAQAVRQAKAAGISLRDYVGQRDAFGGGVSERAEDLLRLAYGDNLAGRVSRGNLSRYLTTYAARAEQQSTQARLFGQNATADELLRAVGAENGPVSRQAGGFSSGQADQRAGNADRGNGERGFGSGAPRQGADSRGSGSVGSGEGGAETLTPETAATHREAMDAKLAHVQRMEGAPSRILAPGKNGAEYSVADSAAAGQFWHKGKGAAEDAQSLVRLLGSRDAALSAVGDYAAYDLRTAAERPDGIFDAKKLNTWLGAHREALDVFPELRQRFGTVQRAQAELDALNARRRAASVPLEDHAADTAEAARHWYAGTRGAVPAGNYLAGGPDRAAHLERAATGSLEADAASNGPLDPAAHASWLQRHNSALSVTSPEYRASVATPEAAARTIEAARQDRAELVRAQQDRAAAHYLDTNGGRVDPQTAIGSLMKADNPGASAAALMKFTSGDREATLGVRRNAADWLMSKVVTGAEDAHKVSATKLNGLLNDPKQMRALSAIFEPDQVQALRDVAADLQREATANAGRGGKGPAVEPRHSSMLGQLVAGEIGGELLGHAVGVASGLGKVGLKIATLGTSAMVSRARSAGLANVDDVLTAAVLNPELARMLLLRPAAAARPAVLIKLRGLLGNLAADGMLRTREERDGR